MKVLILANSSSGLYSFRNEFVQRLLEEYEVTVSVPDDVCTAELEAEGCKVVHTPINRRGMNPFEDYKLIKSYRKLLRDEKPDLALGYTIKPNIYGGWACQKEKVPYMVTITGLGSTFQKEGLLKSAVIKMYQSALKKAECVFFQNKDNKAIFENCRILGKKAKLVQGSGVNLEAHPYKEYPASDDIKRFLFIGRIMKEKGINEFLEAAAYYNDEKTTFEVLGYCEEDYVDILNEYEEKGIIIQHGYQKDVNPYLQSATALILPTFYPEGMSNVLMEASATGRPVFGTNIPGSRDIIDNGVTGYIFEPQNSESLISALREFFKLSYEEQKEMGCQARLKMEREFDRKKVTDDYMNEVHQCLKD